MTLRSIGSSLLLLVLCSAAAFADEVRLRNGDRFTGRLVRVSEGHCEFESSYGAVLRIPQGDIVLLASSGAVDVELTSGDRLVGTIEPGDDGSVSVVSERVGRVEIRIDEIVTIERRAPLQGVNEPGNVRGKGLRRSQDPPTQESPAQDKPFGQEPEEIPQEFLRASALLLAPGEFELDASFSYSRNESLNVEVLSDGSTHVESLRTRTFSLPITLRAGLFDRAEGFVAVPLLHSELEHVDPGSALTTSDDGVGDIGAGLKYLITAEEGGFPEIDALLGFTAPTGDSPFHTAGNPVPLGSGHWIVTGGLAIKKTFDPIIVFGGLEYSHFVSRSFLGSTIQPGGRFGYDFGAAFIINPDVTVSGRFTGAYQGDTVVGGTDVPGTSNEPMSLRAAVTIVLSRESFLEPSVTFGLNDDAADSMFEFAFTQRF